MTNQINDKKQGKRLTRGTAAIGIIAEKLSENVSSPSEDLLRAITVRNAANTVFERVDDECQAYGIALTAREKESIYEPYSAPDGDFPSIFEKLYSAREFYRETMLSILPDDYRSLSSKERLLLAWRLRDLSHRMLEACKSLVRLPIPEAKPELFFNGEIIKISLKDSCSDPIPFIY